MESKKAKLRYDGISSNVRKFLTKVELEAGLKGYEDEKKAQYAASKLEGPAFDVYSRLSDEEKKLYHVIKAELLKEFEKGQQNRDEAIQELDRRNRMPGESSRTYAHKVKELVKLAYPDFAEGTRLSIAKDYFVRGLYADMQLALKTTVTFSSNSIDQLADEVARLELAGVKSRQQPKSEINNCNDITNDAINSIAERVLEKFKTLHVDKPEENKEETKVQSVSDGRKEKFRSDFRSNQFSNRGNNRNRRSGVGNYNASQPRKCRSCFSTEHLLRNCPTRFCQACGQRGHDQFDSKCPNFHP